MLPLHIACLFGCEEGVIRLLLKVYPQAASVMVGSGLLPLHLVLLSLQQQGESTSMSTSTVVRILLQAHPESVRVPCKGRLPRDYVLVMKDPQQRHECLQAVGTALAKTTTPTNKGPPLVISVQLNNNKDDEDDEENYLQ